MYGAAYGHPCVALSTVNQKFFAVLVEWYHHIVLTVSFKLVSFFYIYLNKSVLLTSTYESMHKHIVQASVTSQTTHNSTHIYTSTTKHTIVNANSANVYR